MADTKPGKVIRLNPKLLKSLDKHRNPKESWSDTIERLIGNPEVYMWALPSKLYASRSEARGVAVKEAAIQGLSLEDIESPIKVTEKL